MNIDTGQTIAFLRFTAAVEEIFAVQALPGILSPLILEEHDSLLDSTWAIPDALLPQVELAQTRVAGDGPPAAT